MSYTGAYPNIYPWIASRLRQAVTDNTLADQPPATTPTWVSLDLEISSVVADLVTRYPCVISYVSLTGADSDAFSEAAGLMTAIRLQGPLLTGGTGEGVITSEKLDTAATTYATPMKGQTDADLWSAQADRALLRIPCIGAAYNRFGKSGAVMPSRGSVTTTGEYGTPDCFGRPRY